MRRAALVIAWFFLAAGSGVAQARQPVVVELFTSQGCSSCVAADALVGDIADRPGVLALTLAVDYWDYLGWSDTFARPEFTARQRAYMQPLSVREVYTPQVVVDGASQAAGADRKKIDLLIQQARRAKGAAPVMGFGRHGKVMIGAGRAPRGGADVWLVRYDPSKQEVAVKRGENRGQTLVQRNVVRQLVRLGPWFGKARVYAVPPAPGPDAKSPAKSTAKSGGDTLRTCILVQSAKGGRIVAVLQR